MSRTVAIEAHRVTRRFGSRRAVDDVGFRVFEGESVALFGPNGAGKTTLLRILSSGLRATSGTIRIAGLDYATRPRAIRRRIGVISHNSYLYSDLTVRDNLLFFAKMYGVADPGRAADAMLEAMELSDRAEDDAKTLSRGMTQRLSLARSLVHEPDIVFLDEPFSGLDPHAATVLRETLNRLRAAGRTLLMVTHNIAIGLEMSDRWMLLVGGRLVDDGPSAGRRPEEFGEIRFRATRQASSASRGTS